MNEAGMDDLHGDQLPVTAHAEVHQTQPTGARRRRPDPAGDHRSDAARRNLPDQLGPDGGLPPAGPATHAWLALEAVRIWLEHGPGRTWLGPSSRAAFAISLRGDCAAGYRAGRRILALSEARGYEPDTSLGPSASHTAMSPSTA
jgi:hypothetical protein